MSTTRKVAEQPLPGIWREGTSYPAVERIIEGLSNPWSISEEAARVLARIVVQERRTRILEFGAGMSSRILAAVLGEIGGGRLTSVEENPAWCEEAWTLVQQSPNVDAALIPASVHLKLDRRGIYYGYAQLLAIAKRGPYDLVFVDAPWGIYGRDGALHAAIESVHHGGIVVLDDSARAREQRTLRRWILNYPNLKLVANDTCVGRGLAVLQRSPQSDWRPAAISSLSEVWGGGLFELVRTVRALRQNKRRTTEISDAG